MTKAVGAYFLLLFLITVQSGVARGGGRFALGGFMINKMLDIKIVRDEKYP